MDKSILQQWKEYCELAHAKSLDSPYIIVSQELSKKIKEINGRKNNRGVLRSGSGPDLSGNDNRKDNK